MYRTRFQTRAANFVGICSNRATTGPRTPGGIWQMALVGNPALKSRSAWSDGVVAGALVARVQEDEAAVLQVVDPAGGRAAVVRPVHLGRERPVAGAVDVLAGGRRADRVGHLLAGGHVLVAHVGLDLADLAGRGRLDGVDRGARERRLGGGREHERAHADDHRDDGEGDDRRAEALEAWTAPRSGGAARRGGLRAASPRGWRRACGWTPCRRGRPRRAASSSLSRLAAPCGAATVGTVDRRRTPRQARDAPRRVAATAAQRALGPVRATAR